MNTFGIIMGQIELFVVLILVGILAVKTKILNQEALGYFSKYLMRIAIPVMIFTNTIHGATPGRAAELNSGAAGSSGDVCGAVAPGVGHVRTLEAAGQ